MIISCVSMYYDISCHKLFLLSQAYPFSSSFYQAGLSLNRYNITSALQIIMPGFKILLDLHIKIDSTLLEAKNSQLHCQKYSTFNDLTITPRLGENLQQLSDQ